MYLAGLADAIGSIGSSLKDCTVCGDTTALDVCGLCDDARRDDSIICVVADPQDRVAIERTSAYQGRYHVLGGLLDPLAGIGPKQLRIERLLRRASSEAVLEVIMATSPSVNGDATAMFVARVLEPTRVLVTRISSGVVAGGELEHADPSTLQRAIADRRML